MEQLVSEKEQTVKKLRFPDKIKITAVTCEWE